MRPGSAGAAASMMRMDGGVEGAGGDVGVLGEDSGGFFLGVWEDRHMG